MDLVMNTKWSQENEKELYRRNIDRIPKKSLEGILMGSPIGQIYQVSLDFAKKLELDLKSV